MATYNTGGPTISIDLGLMDFRIWGSKPGWGSLLNPLKATGYLLWSGLKPMEAQRPL